MLQGKFNLLLPIHTCAQVMHIAMERWRAFFGKSNADIWTVIEQAINVAAVDHPDVFKEKRGDIAEALFARSLVQMMPAHDKFALAAADDEQLTSALEEGELKDDYEEKGVTTCQDDGAQSLHVCYDEAQAVQDDGDQEAAVIEEINFIKPAFKEDQPENILLGHLQKLEDMQITVTALKVTEIGKQVNFLRKHPSKYVRAVVKRLVKHWKFLVDEWVEISGDASGAAATSPVALAGSHFRDEPEVVKRLQTPLSPPVNETLSFPMEKNLSDELTKLFSFIDKDICGQTKRSGNPSDSNEPSTKSTMHNSCRSQSGSGLTYSSDCDARVSTSQTWELQTPGEMGSATRDNHISERSEKVLEPVSRGLPASSDMGHRGTNHPSDSKLSSKTFTKNLNAARTSNDGSKMRVASCTGAAGKSLKDSSDLNRNLHTQKSSVPQLIEGDRTVKPSAINKSADKAQVEQKLEIAKRKLHQGYQQAENAKKQRTVQVLDFPDLPKSSEMWGKVNPAVQSKAGRQGSHWGQNKR